MTSDQDRLARYVDTWSSAVDDVVALLRDLRDEEWSLPTDLPGWDVKGVAAHLAHLEAELAGEPQEEVEVPSLERLSAPTAAYTERGLIAREGRTGPEITDELAAAAARRLAQLRENPPTDASAVPAITPGNIGWNWETLLRNRPLDLWMHEQDIRRATGRPGGMDTAGAAHTVTVFTMSLPFSVGKRVKPPAGTTVVLDVTGVRPVHLAVGVNADGRAVPLPEDPAAPDVALRMDVETFVILAGGRRPVDAVEVEVVGDAALGRRVLEALAVTP